MCYTGTCRYECASFGSPSAGECMLKYGEPVPDDADCMVAERWLEEQRRKHPIRTLVNDVKRQIALLRWKMSGRSEIPF